MGKDDVCVVISASGNPKYLSGVIHQADEVGARTIAITCNAHGKVAEDAGLVICVEVGPEVIAGSSRLKAGTAQKMILNMDTYNLKHFLYLLQYNYLCYILNF